MTTTPANMPDWIAQSPQFVQTGYGYLLQALDVAINWLLSPAAWSQFALILAAYFLALIISRRVSTILTRILTPPEDSLNYLSRTRRILLRGLPLLLPIIAYILTGIGESITRSLYGSDTVIAFGKRFFLFLAARSLVRNIIRDPFLKLLGRYVLIPIAVLFVFGLLGPVGAKLQSIFIPLGNMSFDLLWLIKAIVFTSIIFWLGRWSNDQSASYIHQIPEMRPATRQVATKAAEITIFGVAFLVLMNILDISLSSLAILSGAVGVGLGFGLQKIASNFISGIILMLEGQATVGDYVALDNGEAGTIIKTTARAMILETYDGRWIVVPNEDFITTRVVNYSDQGSANRYEAPFTVSYATDINLIPDIVEAAVAEHPEVLSKPFPPDCELRALGENGVEFAVEFWVNGIDDGKNKFTSDVLFRIWNALKANNIEIPFPQRVVHHRHESEGVSSSVD